MSDIAVMEAVAEAESQGIYLRLVDGRLKVNFPVSAQKSAEPLLERLRSYRSEVVEVLRQRSSIPPLPPGVRALAWEPKEPPVVLERWSVVTDVPVFIRATLMQLDAAIEGKQWLAGNWSVQELIDRLEQVGVKLALDSGLFTRAR